MPDGQHCKIVMWDGEIRNCEVKNMQLLAVNKLRILFFVQNQDKKQFYKIDLWQGYKYLSKDLELFFACS